ncbi:MAG: malto-oligosyltrehalose trehalohydrolase [Casimicrobiaceae bacterium]
MRRRHLMPYGAELAEDGHTRFRLWAPGAQDVTLVLGHHERGIALAAVANGWFEVVVPDAPAGSRYAYRIDGRNPVPDPASRANPDDVNAPSAVVDPRAYDWQDEGWLGRPWHEAVIYELHVGTFTPEGTFAAAIERLDHLIVLGITVIELMPVADFPGERNWGYDGVLLFAPDARYGAPEDMKRLIDAAHARGLMVLLDVVYNHFGPKGNHLHAIAPAFFNPEHQTPWGAAINFDGPHNRPVRDFFIHNALYWLTEFHLDGLRLDAVHAVVDTTDRHILMELTETVRQTLRRDRHVHLVFENDDNAAHYLDRDAALAPRHATAQWNDDIHHVAHVLATGESDGYYADYAKAPVDAFGRALAEGFFHQNDWSDFRGLHRGERSAHLPPLAFIGFLQNHDQIGNRAFGERIFALAEPPVVRAVTACLLLAPSPPLLFMGDEFGASSPFLFFCDFDDELAEAVTQGRRNEFRRFARFRDEDARDAIPDPNAADTFTASKLPWDELDDPAHAEWLAFYREIIGVRRRMLVPRLPGIRGHAGRHHTSGDGVLLVSWSLPGGCTWQIVANFNDAPRTVGRAGGTFAHVVNADAAAGDDPTLPPWGVRVALIGAVGGGR